MAMQNKTFATVTTGTVVTAPSGCEAFDIVAAATFSVTYIDFLDQVPIGDAALAVQYGAANFRFTVYAPRGYAFKPGQQIAVVTPGANENVSVVPVRFGN